jgi:hypothetical protein
MQPKVGGCAHNDLTGDPHVTSCKLCGIFYPKSGARTIRSDKRKFLCCFSITSILRNIYAECMTNTVIQVNETYLNVSSNITNHMQMRSMLIDWLTESGE